MDLKWLLVRRITLVAFACFIAAAAIVIFKTASDVKRQNSTIADLVSRQLNVQLARIDRSTDVAQRFPDWDVVTTFALRPGQCVDYRDANGVNKNATCAGIDNASVTTPALFFSLHRALFGSNLSVTTPITYRGKSFGSLHTSLDPVATAAHAWATIAPLLSLATALVAALCIVTYAVVDRALRPAREILSALNRVAQGDLTSRLPGFQLTELNRISEVFNALCAELGKATAERTDLARRLVDAQEQERRHIARELHDEIAQKLAALNALAACVRNGAQREALTLADDARRLEDMASELMISLRRTLTYLRPQEIDDLGLIPSLRGLVDQHNKTARGATEFTFQAAGEIDTLQAETNAHVYRIVQEALANAAKHANARNVAVSLSQFDDTRDGGIRLSVVDDGVGPAQETAATRNSGAGLIGMRERVFALNGKFAAGPRPEGGFGLHVQFPTLQTAIQKGA